MSSFKKFPQLGAAAFAVGLALAGPQPGVAAADSPAEGSSSSADGGSSTPGKSRAGRGPARAAAPAEGGRRAVRSVGERPFVAPGSAAARAPRTAAGTAPVSPAAESARTAAAAAVLPAAGSSPARTAPAMVPAPASAVAAVPVGSSARPVASPASGIIQGAPVPPALAAATAVVPAAPAPVDVVESLNTAVAGFFDNVSRWLSNLPASPFSPISDALSMVFVWLRRELFNQSPTVSPVQQWSDGQLHGHLRAVDAEGEALTFEVVQHPQDGDLLLHPDGTYTYTPAPSTYEIEISTAELQSQNQISRSVSLQVGDTLTVSLPWSLNGYD